MSVVANPYFAPSICGESCMGESLGIWWDKKLHIDSTGESRYTNVWDKLQMKVARNFLRSCDELSQLINGSKT